jgi:hypothetical protein
LIRNCWKKTVDISIDKLYNEEKERFIKNLHTILRYMKLEFYKDRVNRVSASYWQYDRLFSEIGNVKANIHVIQSKRTKIENLDWSPYTSNHFFTYKGVGSHNKMMMGAHLVKSSQIFRKIFKNIDINRKSHPLRGKEKK